ncbi:MAG: hypothetical protein GF344_06315 [Chitinivibrionales bacterium]|nr:hypothetical protein [Chitinivibrionales bacterium]
MPILSFWAQATRSSSLWQELLRAPGVPDCIELNELDLEQPGESLRGGLREHIHAKDGVTEYDGPT